MAIWQDLVTDYRFSGAYNTVKRFVSKLRGGQPQPAKAVIITAPVKKRRSITAAVRWCAIPKRASIGGPGYLF
jgi:hypothetical protein